jgi:Undecaprenyl-phosphate glucose phosphotransferase
MIKENQRYLNQILVLIDGIAIFASLILAWIIRFKLGFVPIAGDYLRFSEYIKPVLFIVPIYLIAYNSFKLYTPQRFKKAFDEVLNIFKANMVGLLVFILLLYVLKIIDYSRALLVIFAIVSIILTTLERIVVRKTLRRMRKRGFNLKHILLVGISDSTTELLIRINDNKQWGYNVVGILDDNKIKGSKIRGVKVLGDLRELEKYLNELHIDDVFITLEMGEYNKLGEIIEGCEKNGVRTNIIPGYYRYIPAKPYVEEIDGLPVINIRYVPLDNMMNKTIKRIIDITGSILAIILFSPFMLLSAVIIKLTSEGPILFKQERIGLNKKGFMMLKFRSMHIQKEEDEKDKWTTANDPRKTKFGNFIRKTSIDELPQFFNVFNGDMSLVGPRPERPFFVEQFKKEIPKYMIKHQVRPGITGWAQINGWRGDTSIKKRIECDLYYIENWSLLFDVKIIFLTIFSGFINKNAY